MSLKINNKKAVIGDTLVWIVAIMIIVFIMFIFFGLFGMRKITNGKNPIAGISLESENIAKNQQIFSFLNYQLSNEEKMKDLIFKYLEDKAGYKEELKEESQKVLNNFCEDYFLSINENEFVVGNSDLSGEIISEEFKLINNNQGYIIKYIQLEKC